MIKKKIKKIKNRRTLLSAPTSSDPLLFHPAVGEYDLTPKKIYSCRATCFYNLRVCAILTDGLLPELNQHINHNYSLRGSPDPRLDSVNKLLKHPSGSTNQPPASFAISRYLTTRSNFMPLNRISGYFYPTLTLEKKKKRTKRKERPTTTKYHYQAIISLDAQLSPSSLTAPDGGLEPN